MNSIYITSSAHSTIILSENGEIIHIFKQAENEFISTVKDLSKENLILCDSKKISKKLASADIRNTIDITNPVLSEWRIKRFELLIENTGEIDNYEKYLYTTREYSIQQARTIIKYTAGKRDELAAQIVHTIDDVQKSYNMAANRISELYSLHFPELVSTVSNPTTLAKIISKEPMRKNISEKMLQEAGLPDDKISYIIDSIEDSLGGELTPTDLEPMQVYAESIISLDDQLKKLENWILTEMDKIAPNLTAVAGANVGARLISAMGSLRQLAMKASSKIQTIGAERALYAALRGRGSPPKHGIIYQIPEVGNSPYWIRGKISRSYAGKIAIAARLDEFGGEFLGTKLREELRELEKKLREQFPNPPEKKITPKLHPAVKRKRNRKKGGQR